MWRGWPLTQQVQLVYLSILISQQVKREQWCFSVKLCGMAKEGHGRRCRNRCGHDKLEVGSESAGRALSNSEVINNSTIFYSVKLFDILRDGKPAHHHRHEARGDEWTVIRWYACVSPPRSWPRRVQESRHPTSTKRKIMSANRRGTRLRNPQCCVQILRDNVYVRWRREDSYLSSAGFAVHVQLATSRGSSA